MLKMTCQLGGNKLEGHLWAPGKKGWPIYIYNYVVTVYNIGSRKSTGSACRWAKDKQQKINSGGHLNHQERFNCANKRKTDIMVQRQEKNKILF